MRYAFFILFYANTKISTMLQIAQEVDSNWAAHCQEIVGEDKEAKITSGFGINLLF